MIKFKYALFVFLFVFASFFSQAQLSKYVPKWNKHQKDTSSVKSNWMPKFSLPKVHFPKMVGMAANSHPVFSLLAGASFSKQTINASGYSSNFNYNLADMSNDTYKPGYFGGVRIDGIYQNKHAYSLSVSLSKMVTGTKYNSSEKLSPVIGSYSSFKGEGQFFVMNIAAHYKKLIPMGDQSRHQFYVVAGPSIDTRLSGTSTENEITDAYKRIFFKGDLGFEFNNRSYYTLFLHYQHNLGSITKSPITTNLNNFELGVFTTASDLF